jgi:hypothetical protein
MLNTFTSMAVMAVAHANLVIPSFNDVGEAMAERLKGINTADELWAMLDGQPSFLTEQ